MTRRTRERVEAQVPADLRAESERRGWPDGLIERVLEAGIPAASVWNWLQWRPGTPEDMEKQILWHGRLNWGDLRGREARISDNDGFC
ncbi:MAG: hypothetical protein HRU01_11475, partial [Myxococcales bacterium]|nr:hypothetical protein [Myxococcales bacterium]